MDELFDQREIAEAERFADVLDTLEAGGQPDIEALVDAELAALLRTADAIREPGMLATETTAFHSYHARSRAYVLHTLEQQRLPAHVAQAPTQRRTEPRGVGIIDFIARHRRWAVLTPVAAAAAAAGLVLFTPLAIAPEDNRPPVAANLTTERAGAELDRITHALTELTQRSTRGEPVDASLLRTITESTTAVANRIETQPQSVSREHVENYQRAVAQSGTVLGAVQPAVGTENALAAAQRATQDGVVTAARFLGAEPGAAPTSANSSTSGGAPTAPKPAAASSATPTATPAATGTPTATPAPRADGTVKP